MRDWSQLPSLLFVEMEAPFDFRSCLSGNFELKVIFLHLSKTSTTFHRAASLLFSCLLISDSMWPLGLQHARLPCPSPSPRACSNLCPLSQWCHSTISSSIVPFSSCLQSFPASGSFPMNWLFTSGGQSIGVSASASVLPMNIQDWFPLGWTGWISSRDSQESLPTPQFKINSSALCFLYSPTLTSKQDHWENHNLD